jgi:hypothetical protein
MDRNRRESKDDYGGSRERRRSRSREKSKRIDDKGDAENSRSKRSHSADRKRNSKDASSTADASRKRGEYESKQKDSTREKGNSERDEKGESGDARSRVRSRDDNNGREIPNSTGKVSSSNTKRDDSTKAEDSSRRESSGKGDRDVSKTDVSSSSSSSKRSRLSRSPSLSKSRPYKDDRGEKLGSDRERGKRILDVQDSRRDFGRAIESQKEHPDHKSLPNSSKEIHTSTPIEDRRRKDDNDRELDDHGREIRNRRSDHSSDDKSSKRDEISKSESSSRRDADRSRIDSQSRGSRGDGCSRDKGEGRPPVSDDNNGQHNERKSGRELLELRKSGDGSRRRSGPARGQYGPGGQEDEFISNSNPNPNHWQGNGQHYGAVGFNLMDRRGGPGGGREGREDFLGPGQSMEGWVMGMEMGAGGGFGPKNNFGWGADGMGQDSRGGGVMGEGFQEDWQQQQQQQQQQHLYPFHGGPASFMGRPEGIHTGIQDPYMPQQLGDYPNPNEPWAWDQAMQHQQQVQVETILYSTMCSACPQCFMIFAL